MYAKGSQLVEGVSVVSTRGLWYTCSEKMIAGINGEKTGEKYEDKKMYFGI